MFAKIHLLGFGQRLKPTRTELTAGGKTSRLNTYQQSPRRETWLWILAGRYSECMQRIPLVCINKNTSYDY